MVLTDGVLMEEQKPTQDPQLHLLQQQQPLFLSIKPFSGKTRNLLLVCVCVCVTPRVQQEQLAAIFLLLKENQEVLGEVTEGDVEEQMKLYSL